MPQETPERPPNIIFVVADQLGACHLNCYGSGVPSTPALDALAARGTRFDRCYATSPVCTPSRATMFTGRSPVANGMISNNYTLVPDTPTFAQVLGHRGYRSGGFGKFHLCPMPLAHPESYAHLGFDESVITEDPKWGDYVEWIRQEHSEHFDAALAVAWGMPRGAQRQPDPRYDDEYIQQARARILQPLRSASPWHLFYTSPLPPELHQTAWITDRSLDFMARHVDQTPTQPFLCHVSYVDPHDPYDPPEPYDRMFDADDMPDPLPAAWRSEGNRTLEEARNWLGFEEISDQTEVLRQLRAHYHGSIKLIDDQVARIVRFLDERRLWDDTIIVFTTDHGEMLGDHELLTKGVKPYDAGIRCPLIAAGRGVEAQATSLLACTLDFFPTFCDWAGVDHADRPPLEGKSFADLCRGQTGPDAWESVQVAFGPVDSVVSDDGWRLTVFDDDASPNQLHNLRDDSSEQANRYNDPGCGSVQTRLFEQLAAHHLRIAATPQYRNLPIVDGRKCGPGGPGNGQIANPVPIYSDPGSTPEW